MLQINDRIIIGDSGPISDAEEYSGMTGDIIKLEKMHIGVAATIKLHGLNEEIKVDTKFIKLIKDN